MAALVLATACGPSHRLLPRLSPRLVRAEGWRAPGKCRAGSPLIGALTEHPPRHVSVTLPHSKHGQAGYIDLEAVHLLPAAIAATPPSGIAPDRTRRSHRWPAHAPEAWPREAS